jgi:uncharacterized protein HemX
MAHRKTGESFPRAQGSVPSAVPGGRHHRRNRGPPGAGAAIGGALGLGAGAVIGDYMQGQEQQQYQTNQQQIQQSQRAIERNSYQIQKARQTEY